MFINVPTFARDHFWNEPPPGTAEFWSMRFPPPCKIGDPLLFRFDKVVVAQAIVARIEKPGESACEGTGRFRNGYKIFWESHTFVDLRRQS